MMPINNNMFSRIRRIWDGPSQKSHLLIFVFIQIKRVYGGERCGYQ